jgi:hypothetical protein
MVGDDGQTVISVVFFESKEAYQRLASDPAQDAFWRESFALVMVPGPLRQRDDLSARAPETTATARSRSRAGGRAAPRGW